MNSESISNIWPEWTIEEEIGQGGFGTVYKAVRHEFGRDFFSAIKILEIPTEDVEVRQLRSEGMSRIDIITYFGEIVTDCINEIAALETLKGHSHIVSVEDFKVIEHKDEIKWDIYIRMELLTSLDDYLVEKEAIPEDEIIRLGLDICDALKACERAKIIHRDIKIENVFVTKFGTFKLGDFGIAKNLEKTSIMFSRKGTQEYMAPEIWKGEEYRADVDLYSLGLLMYVLSNNNRMPFLDLDKPFNSYTERSDAFITRIRGTDIPAPCNASSALAQIILKACSFKPEDRYQTAEEFELELKKIQNGREPVLESGTVREIYDVKSKTVVITNENQSQEEADKTIDIENEDALDVDEHNQFLEEADKTVDIKNNDILDVDEQNQYQELIESYLDIENAKCRDKEEAIKRLKKKAKMKTKRQHKPTKRTWKKRKAHTAEE